MDTGLLRVFMCGKLPDIPCQSCKQRRMLHGLLSPRLVSDYYAGCVRLIEAGFTGEGLMPAWCSRGIDVRQLKMCVLKKTPPARLRGVGFRRCFLNSPCELPRTGRIAIRVQAFKRRRAAPKPIMPRLSRARVPGSGTDGGCCPKAVSDEDQEAVTFCSQLLPLP